MKRIARFFSTKCTTVHGNTCSRFFTSWRASKFYFALGPLCSTIACGDWSFQALTIWSNVALKKWWETRHSNSQTGPGWVHDFPSSRTKRRGCWTDLLTFSPCKCTRHAISNRGTVFPTTEWCISALTRMDVRCAMYDGNNHQVCIGWWRMQTYFGKIV